MPDTKRCTGCQAVKSADHFHRRKARGRVYLRARCKPCENAYNRAHRPTAASGLYRTEEYRAHNRQKMSRYLRGAGRLAAAERQREHVRAHPDRVKAWKAVERALRTGRLTRADRCSCGRDSRVYGHHDDYTRPLDVLWVCGACHKVQHQWLNTRKVAAA